MSDLVIQRNDFIHSLSLKIIVLFMQQIDKVITGSKIGGKYLIGPIIGKGSFGDVFLATGQGQKQLYAVKKESESTKTPQLISQSKILKLFDKIVGFPQVYWVGQENRSNFMVMQLLGPSLEDLFFMCEKSFSLKTVLMLADQMIHKIQKVHSQNYVHRDLKPENFLIGLEQKSHVVHLIDFGLSKRFRDLKTHQHIPYKQNRSFVGTVRYSSINTHFGVQQSRRDDVEAIGYILIYFLKGNLPWQGVKANNKTEKYEKIQEKKLSNPVEIQCSGLPIEFTTYMNYCKTLRYEQRPDYKFLRKLFRDLFDRVGYIWDYQYDWCCFDLKKQIETPAIKIKIEKKGDQINQFFEKPTNEKKMQFSDCIDEGEIGLKLMTASRVGGNGSENVPEDSFIESDLNQSNAKIQNNPKQMQSKLITFW